MTREGQVVPFTEVEVEAAKRSIHVEKRIGEKVGASGMALQSWCGVCGGWDGGGGSGEADTQPQLLVGSMCSPVGIDGCERCDGGSGADISGISDDAGGLRSRDRFHKESVRSVSCFLNTDYDDEVYD